MRLIYLFHICWFIITGSLAYVLYDFNHLFQKNSTPLASLVDKTGLVKFRYVDLNLWNSVDDDQLFYQNEVVATGDSSTLMLTFDGENIIQLEENGQLLIQNIKTNKEMPLLITLFQGQIKTVKLDQPKTEAQRKLQEKFKEKAKQFVKTKEESNTQESNAQDTSIHEPRAIAIRSGTQIISLKDKETAITISKNTQEDEPTIQVTAGKVEIKEVSTGKMQIAQEGFKTVEKPKVIPTIADLYLHPKENLLPKLKWPKPQNIYWIKDIKQNSSEFLTLSFEISDQFLNEKLWIGVTKINDNNHSIFKDSFLKDSNFNDNIINAKIPLKILSSLSENTLKITTGYRLLESITKDKIYSDFFNDTTYDIKFKSFNDFKEKPTTFYFTDINKNTAHPILEQSKDITIDESKYIITFISKKYWGDILNFIPNNEFHVASEERNLFSKKGIYATKQGKIVAKISFEKQTNQSKINIIANAISSEIIFSGFYEDMIFSKSSEKIPNDWTNKGTEDFLYILSNNQLKPINKFIFKNKKAKEFIEKSALAVFSKNVDILYAQ